MFAPASKPVPAAAGAGTGPESGKEEEEEGGGEMTLLEEAQREMVSRGGVLVTEAEKEAAETAQLLRQVLLAKQSALKSAGEIAQGVQYTEPMTTDWCPPRYLRGLPADEVEARREKGGMIVQGDSTMAPCTRFEDMKLPPPILAALAEKGITAPTPIQAQGLPFALAGRDVVGIAFTGSGKTLVFSLPMVLWALQEELRMPLGRGEGPIGIIVCPARELARQTYQTVQHLCEHLVRGGMPELRTMLAIGGEDMRSQMAVVQAGCHMIVATPGRLNDHLAKGRITLDLCKYIALDEGDRMLDMPFDEEVQRIMARFAHQRQTLIFSATMPEKVQFFARNSLVKPVVVNVGRAGATSLDVIQEVEYVVEEAKMLQTLQCLQKTPPPVIIFADKQPVVDRINEYLLLKGVRATSIHGGKSQEERNRAMDEFRACTKDVLVANDVAAKGLDFPGVQHVINFDMPGELENYVHRIGRTGRRGKTGVATTFVNRDVPEETLLDLKHLLMEAKQPIPVFLNTLHDPDEAVFLSEGPVKDRICQYCGGFHRLQSCRKMQRDARAMSSAKRDFLGGEQ